MTLALRPVPARADPVGCASSSPTSSGDGAGHVQSLIFGAVLFNAAVVLAALGIIGDLLYAQRIMAQRTFERVRRIELQLDVPPSHYEPGARPTGQPPTTGANAGAAATEDREALKRMSPPSVTVDREGTVTGNTYDKYGSTNPVVKRLMAGFEGTLDELFDQAAPHVAARRGLRRGRARPHQWAQRPDDERVVGIDLDDPQLHAAVGAAPGAEPRVPGHEGREPAVRRRRVRRRDGDRGPRARPRPGAHGRRDGARAPRAGCSSASRASRCGAG